MSSGFRQKAVCRRNAPVSVHYLLSWDLYTDDQDWPASFDIVRSRQMLGNTDEHTHGYLSGVSRLFAQDVEDLAKDI